MATTTPSATTQSHHTISKRKRAVDGNHESVPKRQRHQPSLTKDDTTRASFADLPGELRTAIYEYALYPDNRSPLRLAGGAGRYVAINLLGATKVIRKEAEALLYSLNTFRIDMPRLCHDVVPMGELDKLTPAGGPSTLSAKDFQRHWQERKARNELERQWSDAAGLPGVHAALQAMGPKRLRQIRSFVFAYHAHPNPLKNIQDVLQCPEKADIAIRLELTTRKPYFSCSIVNELTSEADAKKRDVSLEHALELFEMEVEPRRLTYLARRDVVFFGQWLCKQCDQANVGGVGGWGNMAGSPKLLYRHNWW
ncbi:hypothetical protein LTR78_008545 [Recurvomyces mirabilis]|uniref:Uncharacterized protein n=1 Tax=Recurvomyces mirabilis TaxID=574656 RepID=A0AAE0TQV2_9PEZI|nr:hypothetical protein LTR78_008545 [Recurvomyces mirabilis]KAK5156296.1 hypothetical protein LTS14_005184 [Recurvomyces mirabilis]